MTAGGEFSLKASAREVGAHQRRRVIEQHDEGAFGGHTVVRGEIGVKIGTSQCGGCLASLGSRRRAHPLQELTNDHDPTDAAMAAFPRSAPTNFPAPILKPKPPRFKKAFTINLWEY